LIYSPALFDDCVKTNNRNPLGEFNVKSVQSLTFFLPFINLSNDSLFSNSAASPSLPPAAPGA
jgi:hypothetical protein